MTSAYRGFNYKPHSGPRLKDPSSDRNETKKPIDATLFAFGRHYEDNPAKTNLISDYCD